MKRIVLACMLLTFLTACPSPDDDPVPPEPIEVDIASIKLTSLVEIQPEEARAMIDQVRSPESQCANASADIVPAELKSLLGAKGVTGSKILRANYPATEQNQEMANRPTFVIAIFVDKIVRFYKPLNVCPPPDKSTCTDGLNFPTQNQ